MVPLHGECAEQMVLAQERDGHYRAVTAPNEHLAQMGRIARLDGDVADFHRLAGDRPNAPIGLP